MQLSRESYRIIKGYNKEEMESFLSTFYMNGYNDGITAFSKNVINIIEDSLKSTPGIGEKRFNNIMTRIVENFSNQ